MRNRNTSRALCLILVLILLFSGCTAKTTTKQVPKEVTVVVEKVVTQEVPKEVTRVVEKVVKAGGPASGRHPLCRGMDFLPARQDRRGGLCALE